MTYYYQSGDNFMPSDESNLNMHKKLPVGTYFIKFDKKQEEFFFQKMEDFKPIQGKVYGDVQSRADRIFNTFYERENSTGVLLVGDKGSGKTMLAKIISLMGYENGIPTIVVNKAWPDNPDKFNKLIYDIKQPCVIQFDEFEKVFTKHSAQGNQQAQLLTLLDGSFTGKKLFVLTANNRDSIDDHFENRPGRIFYGFNYVGLEEAFVREYCDDNLDKKEEIDKIVSLAKVFSSFNFDMLKALVEEMNRYEDSVDECLEYLNIKPSGDLKENYNFTVYHLDKDINHCYDKYDLSLLYSPLSGNVNIDSLNSNDGNHSALVFEPSMITSLDRKNGIIVYQNGDYGLVAKKVDTNPFDYKKLI